jgi:hypothetical protein
MSVLGLPSRLLGAAVVGFATILLPKTRPDDHWSTTPKVEVVSESERIGSTAPGRRRREGSPPYGQT